MRNNGEKNFKIGPVVAKLWSPKDEASQLVKMERGWLIGFETFKLLQNVSKLSNFFKTFTLKMLSLGSGFKTLVTILVQPYVSIPVIQILQP